MLIREPLDYPDVGVKALRRPPKAEQFEAINTYVARTLEDLQRVFAIRAAVFMAEQNCPYNEEYDGNDLTGMHLVSEINGDPVATLRLRWFAGFGKIERVCILDRVRGRQIDRIMLAHAIEIAAEKGYRLMIGQIQARLWPLWSRVLHCDLRDERAVFAFSGFAYREIHIPVPSHASALSPLSDPYRLIRPEGAWKKPGVLEASAPAIEQSEAA